MFLIQLLFIKGVSIFIFLINPFCHSAIFGGKSNALQELYMLPKWILPCSKEGSTVAYEAFLRTFGNLAASERSYTCWAASDGVLKAAANEICRIENIERIRWWEANNITIKIFLPTDYIETRQLSSMSNWVMELLPFCRNYYTFSGPRANAHKAELHAPFVCSNATDLPNLAAEMSMTLRGKHIWSLFDLTW